VRDWLERAWYGGSGWCRVLLPLSALYCTAAVARRLAWRSGLRRAFRAPVPVIVVGNLTVGGTGKTPLVIWLARFLRRSGFRPGVVSRGYGGRARRWPQQVRADADPVMVGDEALVIARHSGCPMAVGPDRVAAVEALLAHSDCDIIISDDGLQHYRLGRTVEIATVDGRRRLGNGHCLPAGPLREPASRLGRVDFVVVKGGQGMGADEYPMHYEGDTLVNLRDENRTRPLAELRGRRVHAVAGLGDPAGFFDRLREAGLEVEPHSFPDHHAYIGADLAFGDDLPVVMTEKDAVKCTRYARDHMWYLPVEARLPDHFGINLLNLLEKRHG